jgi:hypothetical protein
MELDLASWWRRKRIQAEARRTRTGQAHRVTEPYHAVSIKAGPSCRQTHLKYGRTRYLSNEAPSIPLPTCDTQNCRCRYVHFKDRREGFDRRLRDVWNPNAARAASGDRRRGHGRRATDL